MLVIAYCATLVFCNPIAQPQRWYSNGRSYSKSGRQPNRLLKKYAIFFTLEIDHFQKSINGLSGNNHVIYDIFLTIYRVGTAGVLGGATLTGVGLLTNNNGLTNAGLNLGAAGVGSKLLAHVFGKK